MTWRVTSVKLGPTDGIAASADGNYLYGGSATSQQLNIIGVASGSLVVTIPVKSLPKLAATFLVALSPMGGRAYVVGYSPALDDGQGLFTEVALPSH